MKTLTTIGPWAIGTDGTMVHESPYYYIEGSRLNNENWILHMADKRWVDVRIFVRAFFTACRIRGLDKVTIRADFTV